MTRLSSVDLWSKQQNGESIRLLYGLLKKRDSFMMFENSLLVICSVYVVLEPISL